MTRMSSARWATLSMTICLFAWTTSGCIVRVDDDDDEETDVGVLVPPSDGGETSASPPDAEDDVSRHDSSDDEPSRDAGMASRDGGGRTMPEDTGNGTTNRDARRTRQDAGSHNPWPGLLDAANGAPDEPDTSSPPSCKSPRIRCNGSCIDPRSNDQHCDRCNNACGTGRTCEKRSCQRLSRVEAVIQHTNQARSTSTDCGQYGKKSAVPPVKGNAELHKAAQAHADSMAKNGFFAHKDPTDGSTFVVRVNRTNYSGRPVGENIAAGGRSYSARQIVQSWVRSDGHCRNLANPDAREIGVGYAQSNSGKYGAYWVQVFGR